jgi:hypothetical protein
MLKVLKYGVGEGRRRLIGPIVWKMKNYDSQGEQEHPTCNKTTEG